MLLKVIKVIKVIKVTQTAGDAQPHPGHYLATSGSVDQPEGDPGAGHDDDQREVGPGEKYIQICTYIII